MAKQTRLGRLVGVSLDRIAILGGWALLALAVLIGVEVLLRKLVTLSIGGVDEIGGYVLAVTSVIGFIYCLANHGHIRVDVALKYMPATLRAVLHLVAYVLLAAFSVLLAWRAGAVFWRSVALDAVAPTPLGTPLVYPQGLWFLGLVIFAVFAVTLTLQLIATLATKGPAEVERRFHADRLDEEFEAEQRDARRRAAEAGRPPA